MMKGFYRVFALATAILMVFQVCTLLPAFAQNTPESGDTEDTADMEDISLGELLNIKYIETATKHLMEARKAPAIAAVITADEIRNMGARNLMDILRNVPGLALSNGASLIGESLLEVRGIRTGFYEKVLLLIDGHRTNNAYTGSWKYVFHNLMVGNIAKVEVVRGPGSALYGANAFIAVINVITKSAEEIEGQQISISGGSFNTQHYTALFSHKGDRFQISGHADYFDTDGPASLIEADVLTPQGTGLAPGDTLEWAEKKDFGLKIKYKDFSFNSRFINKKEGPYIGILGALNDETVMKFTEILGDLVYTKNLTEALNISLNLYADIYDQDAFIEIFPEGFTGKDDKGSIGNPILKNRTLGSEIMASYDAGDHYMTSGFAYEEIRQYDLESYNNFANPFADPVKTPEDKLFNNNLTRKICAVYLQDMWQITDYDSLTLGIRHDNYNDFGGTTNPRIGYVHEFGNSLILKLLYGSAFRAPTFNELYTRNNPSVIGNSDLKPEKIRTYEAGLEYPFLKHFTLRMNYFHNDVEDLIKTGPKPALDEPAPWINAGEIQVDGFESELNFNFGKDRYGYVNCSYQYGKDENGKALPHVARWKANAGLNYPLSRYLNANMGVSWTGTRERTEGDTRDDLSAMTLVDLTLIASGFWKNLEIRGSFYNLFDEDYRNPSAAELVPNDYPVNPRSFIAEVRYKF